MDSLAEQEKLERLRDRMLQCPICMDEYKDPRILTCHHTVCLNCLLDYVHASSSSGRMFRYKFQYIRFNFQFHFVRF